MFEISWSEIFIVAVVAIIFVGPKELPAMLRACGRMISQLRRTAGEFQRTFNDALKEAERQANVDKMRKDLDAARSAADPTRDLRKSVDDMKAAFSGKPTDPVPPSPAAADATAAAASPAAPMSSAPQAQMAAAAAAAVASGAAAPDAVAFSPAASASASTTPAAAPAAPVPPAPPAAGTASFAASAPAGATASPPAAATADPGVPKLEPVAGDPR